MVGAVLQSTDNISEKSSLPSKIVPFSVITEAVVAKSSEYTPEEEQAEADRDFGSKNVSVVLVMVLKSLETASEVEQTDFLFFFCFCL